MTLSRKDKKEIANKKRKVYFNKIADYAIKLSNSALFNSPTFALDMDKYIHLLLKQHPLDSHLIRQSGREYARRFIKGLERSDK